jgi:rRNA maturation endonuclease Nob1
MVCEQCGAELKPDARFCEMCGSQVECNITRKEIDHYGQTSRII